MNGLYVSSLQSSSHCVCVCVPSLTIDVICSRGCGRIQFIWADFKAIKRLFYVAQTDSMTINTRLFHISTQHITAVAAIHSQMYISPRTTSPPSYQIQPKYICIDDTFIYLYEWWDLVYDVWKAVRIGLLWHSTRWCRIHATWRAHKKNIFVIAFRIFHFIKIWNE